MFKFNASEDIFFNQVRVNFKRIIEKKHKLLRNKN